MLIRRELKRMADMLERELTLTRESQERIFSEMAEFKREERLRTNKVLEPLIRNIEKLNAGHDDLIAESRAQRAALLQILDEMRGGGGRPGGAPA